MSTVDFFFDYSSPFAYLGSTQIPGVAARCDAVVVYEPFLLGGLFKAIGTPMVPMQSFPEPKRRMYLDDLHRWADHLGVDFRFPSRFPMNSVKALRLTLALERHRWPSLADAIFRAYWAEDRDISQPPVLQEILEDLGLDADTVQRIADPEIKQRLFAQTEKAERRGVCGAPFFFVDDRPFWGQDRLHFVEAALRGWRSVSERC